MNSQTPTATYYSASGTQHSSFITHHFRLGLLCLFLFGCFWLATQDPSAPLLWRDAGDADIAGWVENVSGGRAQRQIGFLLLAAYGLIGLIWPARRGDLAGGVRPVWPVLYPLIALVAWAYASLLWSADFSLTAKRLVVFTAMWTAVAATLRHFALRDVVAATIGYGLLSYAVGAYAELTVGLAVPPAGEPWRLAGMMSPNHLGLTSAVLVLACLHGRATAGGGGRRFALLVLMAVAFAAILATRSRTALAAAVAAAALFVALRAGPARAAATAAIGLLAAGVGFFAYNGGLMGEVWEAALLGRSNSDVRTFTGRTDIWAYALQQVAADPGRMLAGFGHDSFWNDYHTAAVSRRVGFTISEAHNVYLELWLNLGAVGVLAWLGAVVGAAIVWLGRGRGSGTASWSPDAAFAVSLAALALIHGLVESTFAHAQFPTFVLFCCCLRAAFARRDD